MNDPIARLLKYWRKFLFNELGSQTSLFEALKSSLVVKNLKDFKAFKTLFNT